MKSKKRLLFLLIIFFQKFLLAGICDPETFAQDDANLLTNEFRNEIAIQNKLLSLLREMQKLSQVTFSDESEKAPIKACLKKKETLFHKLNERAKNIMQYNPLFYEINGDYSSFKNYPDQALKNYDQALKADPKNLGLLIKAYENFTLAFGINLKNISDINTKSEKTRIALEKAAIRARKISEHPGASKNYALEHLYYQALIAQSLIQTEKEISLWEKILSLNPKDSFAIRSRLKSFLNQKDAFKIQKEFGTLVRQNFDNPKDWEQVLGFLANNQYHQEFITLYKKSSDDFKHKHPALKIFLIRSMLNQGRLTEAKEMLQTINFKILAPFSKIDKENKSRINEFEADELKKQDRLSEALDLYKKSLNDSPNPLTIKEKISLLIYEYRKSLNFKPAEATKKDLQEVTELLEKSAFQTELKSNLFEIYIHALTLTQNTKDLKKACLRFIQLYPQEKNKNSYKDNCLK